MSRSQLQICIHIWIQLKSPHYGNGRISLFCWRCLCLCVCLCVCVREEGYGCFSDVVDMVWIIATVCSSEFCILRSQTTWTIITIVKWQSEEWLFCQDKWKVNVLIPGARPHKHTHTHTHTHTNTHTHTYTFAVVKALMDTCRPTLFSFQSIQFLFKAKYIQARATCLCSAVWLCWGKPE